MLTLYILYIPTLNEYRELRPFRRAVKCNTMQSDKVVFGTK